MDKNEYIRRMEAVMEKANRALIKMTNENAALKAQVADYAALKKRNEELESLMVASSKMSSIGPRPFASSVSHDPRLNRNCIPKLHTTVTDSTADEIDAESEPLAELDWDKVLQDSSEEEQENEDVGNNNIGSMDQKSTSCFEDTSANVDSAVAFSTVTTTTGVHPSVCVSMTEMSRRLAESRSQVQSMTNFSTRVGHANPRQGIGSTRRIPFPDHVPADVRGAVNKEEDGAVPIGNEVASSTSSDALTNHIESEILEDTGTISNTTSNSRSGCISIKQKALPGKSFSEIVSLTQTQSLTVPVREVDGENSTEQADGGLVGAPSGSSSGSGALLSQDTTKAAGTKLYAELAVITNCKQIIRQVGFLCRTVASVSEGVSTVTVDELMPASVLNFLELLVDSFATIIAGHRIELTDNSVKCGGHFFVEKLLVPLLMSMVVGLQKSGISARLLRLAWKRSIPVVARGPLETEKKVSLADVMTQASRCYLVLSCCVRFRLDALLADFLEQITILNGMELNFGSVYGCAIFLSAFARPPCSHPAGATSDPVRRSVSHATSADMIYFKQLIAGSCDLSAAIFVCIDRLNWLVSPCRNRSNDPLLSAVATLTSDMLCSVKGVASFAHIKLGGGNVVSSSCFSYDHCSLDNVVQLYREAARTASKCDTIAILSARLRCMFAAAGIWDSLQEGGGCSSYRNPHQQQEEVSDFSKCSDCSDCSHSGLMTAFEHLQLRGIKDAAVGIQLALFASNSHVSVDAVAGVDVRKSSSAARLVRGLSAVCAWNGAIDAFKAEKSSSAVAGSRAVTVWSVEKLLMTSFVCKWEDQLLKLDRNADIVDALNTDLNSSSNDAKVETGKVSMGDVAVSVQILHAYFQSAFINYARCSPNIPGNPVRDFGWKVGEVQFGESLAMSLTSRLKVARTKQRELFVSVAECCSKTVDIYEGVADPSESALSKSGPCPQLAAISRRHDLPSQPPQNAAELENQRIWLSLPFLTTSVVTSNDFSRDRDRDSVNSVSTTTDSLLSESLELLDQFQEATLAAQQDGVVVGVERKGNTEDPKTEEGTTSAALSEADVIDAASNNQLLDHVSAAFIQWNVQMQEVRGLLSLACLECLYYSSVCSMNALLQTCLKVQLRVQETQFELPVRAAAGESTVTDDGSAGIELCNSDGSLVLGTPSDFVALCTSVIRFLTDVPLPWGGNSNGAHVVRVSKLATHLTSIVRRIRRYKSTSNPYVVGVIEDLPLDITRWLESASARIPSLVINLDQRFDRWHRLLRQWESNGMLAIRFSAKDGELLNRQMEVPVNEVQNAQPQQQKQQLTTALVTEYWDSTLNATFDKKCISSPAVKMSNSERGCAWSHLSTWKSIQLISSALFGSKLMRFEENSAGDGMEGWVDAVLVYRASFGGGAVPLLRPRVVLGVETGATLKKRLKQRVITCEAMPYFDALRLLHPHVGGGRGGKGASSSVGAGTSTTVAAAAAAPGTVSDGSNGHTDSGMMDWYLIMEDDAVVRYAFDCSQMELRSRILSLLTEIPSDWDILYLGCVVAEEENVRVNRQNSSKGPSKKRDYQDIAKMQSLSKHLKEVHYSWHAHAYILRSTTATKLLRFLPVHMPVDNFISTLVFSHKLKAYAASTQLVKQQNMKNAEANDHGNFGNYGHGSSSSTYRGDIRHSASMREGEQH